eukprot:6488984-Amphidinium_carterae.1
MTGGLIGAGNSPCNAHTAAHRHHEPARLPASLCKCGHVKTLCARSSTFFERWHNDKGFKRNANSNTILSN